MRLCYAKKYYESVGAIVELREMSPFLIEYENGDGTPFEMRLRITN